VAPPSSSGFKRSVSSPSLTRRPPSAGGTKHWSGGDAKEGALFYQEGLGKFDINPVK